MGLNDVVSSERLHIGFFGKRNAGKSSVVNAVTAQELSLVSDIKGTTTDPVKKAMELLPLGPVVIIDTPGFDDVGHLGEMRVRKTRQILNQTDIAVLIVDGTTGMDLVDEELTSLFKERKIPYIIAYNKSDLLPEEEVPSGKVTDSLAASIWVSAVTGFHIYELKELIGHLVKQEENQKRLVADLLSPNDQVVLVVPIDSAAPKGRLILPQQQTIRDILEAGAIATVVRESELEATLEAFKQPPRMVITDSQAFGYVSKIVPTDVPLTSFSILMVRYKGNLAEAVRGAAALDHLQDMNNVLICEACTHHRQCGDIGTQKLPAWIRNYTKKDLNFEFTSGGYFPEDLSKYSLIVHCGGCMINEREMQHRIRQAIDAKVPITNYGVCIAQIHGILKRSLEPFPAEAALLKD
ncbi:MAG: [FeFe] hydrogenase H-cluster maturation GTPase HydF [Muricoprocola sp.]